MLLFHLMFIPKTRCSIKGAPNQFFYFNGDHTKDARSIYFGESKAALCRAREYFGGQKSIMHRAREHLGGQWSIMQRAREYPGEGKKQYAQQENIMQRARQRFG